MTDVPNLGPEQEAAGGPLLDQIRHLASILDAIDPSPEGPGSPGPGSAMDELLVAARRTVQAARPVLTARDVLIGAVHDAVEYREPEPEGCRDCDRADDGELCPDHANDTATSAAYQALGRALLGDGYRNA